MNDLTKEFREGMDAAPGATCPYYLTSDCADAWYVGQASRELRFTPNMTTGRATRGRGGRINIITASGNGKAVMHVDSKVEPPVITWIS